MIAILIQFAIIVILLTMIITQVTIPALKSKPLFPMFRNEKEEKVVVETKNDVKET